MEQLRSLIRTISSQKKFNLEEELKNMINKDKENYIENSESIIYKYIKEENGRTYIAPCKITELQKNNNCGE